VFIDDGARIAKNDFLNQRLGYWIGFVTADAPATEDNVIKLHLLGIPGMNLPGYLRFLGLRARLT